MTPAKILTLIRELKAVEIKKDRYLFKQGERGEQAFIVLDGELLLFNEDSEVLFDEETIKMTQIQENQKEIRQRLNVAVGGMFGKKVNPKPHV